MLKWFYSVSGVLDLVLIGLNRLQKLQNRAARIATSSPYDASSQPLLKELEWPTVKELIETETAILAYRSMNEEAPNYPYSSVR